MIARKPCAREKNIKPANCVVKYNLSSMLANIIHILGTVNPTAANTIKKNAYLNTLLRFFCEQRYETCSDFIVTQNILLEFDRGFCMLTVPVHSVPGFACQCV